MATPPVESLHRFTYEDVRAMEETGLFAEGQHVELEAGLLVERPAPGPEHDDCVEWLTTHFVGHAAGAYRVRVQSTFRIPDGGYYEPDLMVITPLPRGEQPWSAQLVVEVAVSSRPRDLHKATMYGRAGVPEYWLVDVQREELLVHTAPQDDGYGVVRRVRPGEEVQPPVAAPPVELGALLRGPLGA